MSEPIGDIPQSWPVVATSYAYQGSLIGVRQDTVQGPDGETFRRDVVTHMGAVAVLAVDAADRVLVVEQYRHPAQRRLVELPAGLLDKEGEDPLEAAKRELAEEGHVRAERWSLLLRLMPSPGMTDETITIYLAEGATDGAPPDDFVARHEEASMTRTWVPARDLVDAVLDGRVANAPLVAGILAWWTAREQLARPEPDGAAS